MKSNKQREDDYTSGALYGHEAITIDTHAGVNEQRCRSRVTDRYMTKRQRERDKQRDNGQARMEPMKENKGIKAYAFALLPR